MPIFEAIVYLTKQDEMDIDSERDRPVPNDAAFDVAADVVVTPAMLLAGVEMFDRYQNAADEEFLIEAVYRTMRALDPRGD